MAICVTPLRVQKKQYKNQVPEAMEEEEKREENTTWYHEGPDTLKIGQLLY